MKPFSLHCLQAFVLYLGFKDKKLIPVGYQLSAPAIALMMGYPEDWFAALSPFPQILLAESAPVSLLDEL
jgi:hypothetical protein